MSRRYDTAMMRTAETPEEVKLALFQAAAAIEGISAAVEPAIRPDGTLRRENNTVAIVENLALIAQHQPRGTVTISGGAATPTATFTNIDGALLDDAATEGIASVVHIPREWQGKRISLYCTWAHSEASTTGNVRFRISTLPVAVDEDDTASQVQEAVVVSAAATNGDNEDLFQETKFTRTIAIGTSDVLLFYEFVRTGTHASDNFGAGVWAYTLLFVNER